MRYGFGALKAPTKLRFEGPGMRLKPQCRKNRLRAGRPGPHFPPVGNHAFSQVVPFIDVVRLLARSLQDRLVRGINWANKLQRFGTIYFPKRFG